MNVLIEGAIVGLLGNLLTELAGAVRRRLSSDPVRQALKAAFPKHFQKIRPYGVAP